MIKCMEITHQPLVSIIIPAYNCEKTIVRCVDSAINQTYVNCEVIIVNDGSTDKTGELLKSNYFNNSKVNIIYQDNAGVSSARNTGIINANGKYIFFLDSDDSLPKDSIRDLLKRGLETKAELMVGRYSYNNHELGKSVDEQTYNGKNEITDYLALNQSDTGYCKIQPWGKLFLKSVINNNDIQFDQEMSLGEDTLFVLQYIHCIDSISLCNKIVYNYNQVDGSLSNSKGAATRAIDARIQVFEARMKILNEWNTVASHPQALNTALSDISMFLRLLASDSTVDKQTRDNYIRLVCNNQSYYEGVKFSKPNKILHRYIKQAVLAKKYASLYIIIDLLKIINLLK